MSKVIYHRHHVVPRHAGGTDDPSNMTCPLTVEEHAEHHRYRYEMLGEWQDRIAWQGLLGMITKQETIHQVLIENGRRKRSEEELRKLAESLRGRKFSDEHRRKLRGKPSPMLGKTHSEETKKAIGIASSKHQKGSGNSMHGMMWITNEHVSMRIKKTDPIPNGFRKGRVLSVLVPPAGFEPAAHSLEGCCSVQLS